MSRPNQSTLQRPASPEALRQSLSLQAEYPGPLDERHRAAVKREPTVVADVVHLCAPRNPLAVAGLVVAIDLDTVDLHARRSRPHIAQEGLKTVLPRRTHGDAAPAVVAIDRVLGVEAAGFRVTPSLILWASYPASHSVGAASRGQQLAMKAPATLALAALQQPAGHRAHAPAIAATFPMDARRYQFRTSKNEQPPEALADQVDEKRHAATIARYGVFLGPTP